MNITEKVKEKILPYLIDTDECIEYKTLNKDGYSSYRLKIDNINYHYSMHRVMYQIYYNDNVQDKVSKGRQAKGKDNGRYKNGYNSIYDNIKKPIPIFDTLFSRSLTKELVEEIKEKIINRGNETLKNISIEYNIPYQTIRDISYGRTYKMKNP